MIHGLITLIFCVIVGCIYYFIGYISPWICLCATCWYMGREYTQAEYRYIEQYCNRKRENMPWYGGLSPKVWNLKSTMDWLIPLIVSIVSIVILIMI